FNVIVGMDWLSKRKFVIVCHEKVVRIPLEGDEILWVHGERTQGVVKNLNGHKDEERARSLLEVSVEVTEEEEVSKSNSKSKSKSKSKAVRNWMIILRIGRWECRSPVLWAEIGESSLIRLELLQGTTDKVVLVKEKPKAARDRQKSYVDYGLKLAPRYVGPFEILEKIGPVAYRLRLPDQLIGVHDAFYVSNLKKCLGNANLHVSLNEIKIEKTLRFVEEPIEIMDREVKSLKRSIIPLVKVRWNSKHGPEFT
nr:putative reverse transcriptase domain-containing protein [Tanacetum cinerariifolium]